MQDPSQGQSVPASSTPEGQGQPEQTSADLASLQSLVPESTPASATPEGQGQPAQTPEQISATIPLSKFHQEQAQRLAAERQLQLAKQQFDEYMQRFTPQQPQGNPYDYNADPQNWLRWENQTAAKQAALEASKATQQQFMGLIQQLSENQWAQTHPGVDVGAVKAFAQMRGIQNIDDAWKLMTYDDQIRAAQTKAAQGTINQFRQPQNTAQPVRGANATTNQPTQLSFEKALEEYTQNPSVYDRWPKGLQEAFDRELDLRHNAG